VATRRQALGLAILERISAVRTADGFETDLGALVFWGEAVVLGDGDPEIAAAVIFGSDIVSYQGENVLTTLPIEIQVVAKANLDKPWLTIEAALGDVKRAMETADRTLGGLIPRQIRRGMTRTLPREPGSEMIGLGLTYLAELLEAWGRP
jgi:hypothetical protein